MINIMNRVFSFTNYNDNILYNSSSGGAFQVIASFVLNKGGVVYGSAINSDGFVHQERIESISDISKLMKSKYVWSDIGDTYQKCMNDLNEGFLVFYVGTPCQIFGLKKYLSINDCATDNLITADFVCHGTPNPIYWSKYLNYLERKGIITKPFYDINFRYKEPSWELFSLKINSFVETINVSKYMRLFLDNYSLNKNCYGCKFKGNNRCSDITFSDYWGCSEIDKKNYSKNGTSLLIIRSKDDILIDLFQDNGFLNETNLSIGTYFNSAYWDPVSYPSNYNEIIDNFSFDSYTVIHQKNSIKQKIRKTASTFIKNKVCRMYEENIISRTKKNQKMVGIVTLDGYGNYGNRLQNYALHTFLRNEGYDTYNIVLSKFSFLGKYILTGVRFVYYLFGKKTCNEIRTSAIKKAALKYEKNVYFYYTKRDKKKIQKFGTVVYGSDQVWNASDDDFLFRFGFLGLSRDNEPKKLSYAAGVNPTNLSEKQVQRYVDFLGSFKAISVRESNSNEFLKKLGFNSCLVLDPTLLLDESDWDMAIEKYSNLHIPKGKYVLVYVFGGVGKNEITFFAKENNYEIVDVFDKNSNYYYINHFDFIKLVKYSEFIFTDSYHCLLFSLIFKKKYKLFDRPIPLGSENRFNTMKSLIIDSHFNHDRLEEMKAKSKKYLLTNLCL